MIAQTPNTPLLVVIAFFVIGFIPNASIHIISMWGLRTSLLYWSYLEITSGVNLWRKFLGAATLAYVLITTTISLT
ncbi:hypothetical protein CO179_04325 [candidate division WWE3 bacterium CG_4_9_14_3_um_filter_39_7]|uniref:Lysine transporter LysE n=1 Tax=candidate division WWE3 bacterium CG_4_9_14_3_um_filter_39_7 TaxID=1975080 RepID=A0A2M7X0W7_UNCKA|nr:MAG: hypothetical protein CO179_04325 [candidate division WWE3 bacterium CG_4_9_14_3_um_filter_39_7]